MASSKRCSSGSIPFPRRTSSFSTMPFLIKMSCSNVAYISTSPFPFSLNYCQATIGAMGQSNALPMKEGRIETVWCQPKLQRHSCQS